MTKTTLVLISAFLLCSLVHANQVDKKGSSYVSFDEARLLNIREPDEATEKDFNDVFDQLSAHPKPNQTFDILNSDDDVNNFHVMWLDASKNSFDMNQQAKIMMTAYKELKSKDKDLQLLHFKSPRCPQVKVAHCDEKYLYRSMDGSCNNLKTPWWGKTETPYKRLLEPEYDDGVDRPRSKSVKGCELPNPRWVVMNVNKYPKYTSNIASFFLYFAQFTAHDLAYTSSNYKKCSCDTKDPECNSIPIPQGDHVNKDQRCISSTRSSASVRDFKCSLGPREQNNLLTHWIDLSNVYGDSEEKARDFRCKNGLLKTSRGYGSRDLPPRRPGSSCPGGPRSKACFATGDARTEHNSISVSIHSIWIREHNRIARVLKKINPKWCDDTVYQEARRIVIAEYQNIIYEQFLPIFVGKKLAADLDLLPLKNGYFKDYNCGLYPQISNVFVTAAFRSCHCRVSPYYYKANEKLKVYSRASLMQMNMNTSIPYVEDVDDSVFGTLVHNCPAAKPKVTRVLNDYLFEGIVSDPYTKRWSLPALSINRGRDHGLPGYNKYRQFCGLKKAQSFKDFEEIPPETIADLARIYKHPDDVDVFIGLVSEKPNKRSFLGPTAACIIAKQYRDLKFADRFYYENGQDDKTKFSAKQLDSIRKVSMARILCDNTDLKFVQRNPFLVPCPKTNPIVSCREFARLDLDAWDY
ncbi:peroxidase-like isoform X2 [Brachionus plicatilis]|uniref:Peroxidase-like isoform X2 n=1 Tax=Brachionus plicatilis TaxID=10195 RepID=A0A3M7QBT9_BRAPC|nr:peroxidase-like isoform X2 [Brachionus plicatilis]